MQAHGNQAQDNQRMDASTIQVSANRKAESKTAVDVHSEMMNQYLDAVKLAVTPRKVCPDSKTVLWSQVQDPEKW